MFQNSMPMQQYQHHPGAGMVLGCFIGVMILLVIIIVIIAVADNRLNKMLTNQNNQISTFSSIEKVLAGKHVAGRAQARSQSSTGTTKSGFMTGTNGSQMGSISPSQYPNMALGRQNQQLGGNIGVGGSLNYNPILDGCGSGNCGGSGSSSGMGLYNVQSVSTGANAATASTEAAAELAYFESMLGPEFAAAAGNTGTTPPSRQAPPSRPTPSRPSRS